MFLTKKGFWKIVIMAISYLALGGFCFALGVFVESLDADAGLLFVLGTFCFVCCPIIIAWGRYAEGKGRLLNLGNRLVRNELKPLEFIKEYQRLRNTKDLVVNKPSFDVLHLVVVAYDCLGDKENCLSTIDEMISVSGKKKKTFAMLIKASFLFSYNMVEEAEALFTEARASKQDLLSQALTDAILKGDRAMIMGDYKTVEIQSLRTLAQTFPKPDNLAKLALHFRLGELYEKLQNNEKAISYYKYCVDNGGETAIKESAKMALEKIQ